MDLPYQAAELVQRLRDDQRRRWQSGERRVVEAYLAQHPELLQDEEGLLDFIYGEYCLREEQGEEVSPREYAARFPQFASQLTPLFALHRSVGQPPACQDATARDTAPLMRAAAASEVETPHSADLDTNAGRIEVRCPSCDESVRVEADTQFTYLTCTCCGSHFSLINQEEETRLAKPLTKLGRFDLIERLGVGGFGTVWKARDQELDRTVAIKIPRQGSMTAADSEKFLREARAAAQLRHANIVSVHEIGRADETLYIVADFIRGLTLGEWLTDRRPPIRDACELMITIANALHHAHERGVIHRDLKPANIMMDEDGQPHLMDFGLARREVDEVTMTVEGQVIGTPAYMSPEQAQGDGHSADRRSDIFSLGVILFELFTGERPFRGNPRMLLHKILTEEAPSPRKLAPNIPKDVETTILKCLEKAPDDRYQTAQALSAELRRFLAGQPLLARPISRATRSARWLRRHKVIAGLALALFSALVIALYCASVATDVLKLKKGSGFGAAPDQVLPPETPPRSKKKRQGWSPPRQNAKAPKAVVAERLLDYKLSVQRFANSIKEHWPITDARGWAYNLWLVPAYHVLGPVRPLAEFACSPSGQALFSDFYRALSTEYGKRSVRNSAPP